MITPGGDYLSNLQAPDIRQYFKHLHWRHMGHSMGHLVASDWADKADDDPVFGIYKKCGLWTRDEAAILYNCAKACSGVWVDIGCHTGWTTSHVMQSGSSCDGVDPILLLPEFEERYFENTLNVEKRVAYPHRKTSNEYFCGVVNYKGTIPLPSVDGFVIDGDHEPGKPREDAQNALKYLADTGVIIFHDFIGMPVREAVTWLMDHGMKARVYWTPHLVACCWRGDFTPPDHVPDSRIEWNSHKRQMRKDFDFRRLG